MSIDITKLTESDRGRWVEYHRYDGGKEKGQIKSWNQKWIFVVYKCDDNWERFRATPPTQLSFS